MEKNICQQRVRVTTRIQTKAAPRISRLFVSWNSAPPLPATEKEMRNGMDISGEKVNR